MKFNLEHIHFRCQDVEATAEYYVTMFDGRIVKRTEARGIPIIRVELGGQTLALSPAPEGAEVTPLDDRLHFGVVHIALKVDDLDATAAELKKRGADFAIEPTQVNPVTRAAFVNAPDGVQVEILQPV